MSLLILFNQASGGAPPPPPPDGIVQTSIVKLLNIQDSQTKQHIPVLGSDIGGNYVQALSLVPSQMTFYSVGTGLRGGDESPPLILNGLSNIIIKTNFQDLGAQANIRLIYHDKNDLVIPGEIITINATSLEENGTYLGELVKRETFGAIKISVLVESISSGTLDIYMAEV